MSRISVDIDIFLTGKHFVWAYRTKVVHKSVLRLILENRLKGLKARLESQISVDIENFLLVNILFRHIEQRLFNLLSSFD